MADYMTISSKHASWKEFCLSKEKETKSFPMEPMEHGGTGTGDAFAFLDDPLSFTNLVALLEDECFLLLPAGGNRVNLVHSCFKAWVDEEGPSVFGILGSRRSSPFKRVNVGQAAKGKASPRVTRSEERKEASIPSWKDPAKCKTPDEFRDSSAASGRADGPPGEGLENLPSACFVHRSIFDIFGNEGSMRAGDLATKATENFSGSAEGELEEDGEEEGDPKKRYQLLLFLWAAENLRMGKVGLSDPQDNDIFDRLAQTKMRKLDERPEKNPAEGSIKEHQCGTPFDHHSHFQSPSSNRSNRSTSPAPDRSKNTKTDRTKSKKPSHGSSDGSPVAKFRGKEIEKGRRDAREGRKKGKRKPSPSPSSSDPSSDSSHDNNEKDARDPTPPRKPSSNSSAARSRSEEKSPTKSRSRSKSSRTKSIRNFESDSSSQKSRQTRKSKNNKSPPSSSPDASSSDDSSERSDSSEPARPRKGARRPVLKKSRRDSNRKRESRKDRVKRRGRRRDSSSSDDEMNLHKAMVRSLQAMTSSQLKRDQKEDKKKSMLSRLSPEGGSLFKLLSAENWKDENPKLPDFTKKILEDRDSSRAIGEIKTISKRWSGRISEKGILSFLASGYAADDISEAPGGFSIFMFSPLGTSSSSDPKSRILQVRSMFGSTELDEDSIKYFAKNDFYLADNLSGLEEQIYTCIKLLEKLTCKDGIASEGHRHGFEMLGRHKKEFLGLTRMDPLFPVKFACLLDRAFQNFALDLGDFHNSEKPILRARRALKGQQVQDIEAAMSGFKTGSLATLFLPRTLQTETPSKGDHPSKDGGPSGAGGSKQKGRSTTEGAEKGKFEPEDWWSKNPSPVPEWKIPAGKTFTDFFDFNKESLKANTMGWPRIKSHDPRKKGKKTYLCLKHQCVGNCSNKCGMTHIDPERLDEQTKKAIDDRLKLMFG